MTLAIDPYPALLVAYEDTVDFAAVNNQHELRDALIAVFGQDLGADAMHDQLCRGERVDECVGDGCRLLVYLQAYQHRVDIAKQWVETILAKPEIADIPRSDALKCIRATAQTELELGTESPERLQLMQSVLEYLKEK